MQITETISWVRFLNRVFGFNFMLYETNFIFMINGTDFFMLFALMLFGT